MAFRVQLFCIAQEARHEQHNYLFGEHQCIGIDGTKSHGPDSVLFMLHHYLICAEVKPSLRLHADNCTGQNKNKTVIAYLLWRCSTGLSTDTRLSFMRVGHTLRAVDGYFGLVKQKKGRAKENDAMADVKEAVDSSCGPNQAVLFPWTWHEWDTFLVTTLKSLAGISKYQHFKISQANPQHVECRETPGKEVTLVELVKDSVELPSDSSVLLSVLPTRGLSSATPAVSAALPWAVLAA